jgi:hypothetical protein
VKRAAASIGCYSTFSLLIYSLYLIGMKERNMRSSEMLDTSNAFWICMRVLEGSVLNWHHKPFHVLDIVQRDAVSHFFEGGSHKGVVDQYRSCSQLPRWVGSRCFERFGLYADLVPSCQQLAAVTSVKA